MGTAKAKPKCDGRYDIFAARCFPFRQFLTTTRAPCLSVIFDRWPSQTCGPISSNRRLEVTDLGDVLDDVLAGLVLSVPDVLLG
jgi:hypothetical protein